MNASYFYDCNSLAADMARLHAEVIEIDTKQPAPKNLTNEPLLSTVWRWENPRTWPRHADANTKNSKDSWNKFSCPTADMDLLMIFQLCMPEEFIREVCIPATNKHIEGEKLTLPEFYKWLGCRFFMACLLRRCPEVHIMYQGNKKLMLM